MSFRQCPKRLYLEVYHPELQEDDAGAARVMNQGNVVGEVARGVYSGGTLIGHENVPLRVIAHRRGLSIRYQTCLKAAAVMFPDLSEAIASVLARLVDLFPIVRQGYYHPAMRGSSSIMALVPTIASELDYGNLGEVRDGGGAQDSYLELIAKEAKQDRREALRDDLLAYCETCWRGLRSSERSRALSNSGPA